MESSHFDELTKALATSTSRRQALQRIGGILGGTALAGLFPGLAFASTSSCAKFCNAVFGEETKAAGKCISDAAHGAGLCHTCGSSTPASSICCSRNSSGFCSSYSPTLPCSCPTGQTCQNGTCVTPCSGNGGTCTQNSECCSGNCSNGFCCAAGQVGLSNGTCATPCDPDNILACACGVCTSDASGGQYCASNGSNIPCSTDKDCPGGQFCQPFGTGNLCTIAC